MRRLASPGLLTALLFLLLGVLFLQKAGIHYDASYELGCFYSCTNPAFKATLIGQAVPLMVLPYLGALKAWLYWPLLHFLEITPVVLRVPTLVIGAVSVWLSFLFLDRVSGRRAAVAGSLLLATDAPFLIATTYDFGPIAVLHCFFLAGVLLLLRFERTRASVDLALAFFLFGLALWQKALVIWMLNGLAVAAVLIFHRRIRAVISLPRIGIAAVSLCLGALLLIYFNVVRPGATLHTGSVMSGQASWAQKALVLQKTMSGNMMFGWLTEENSPETATAPRRWAGKTSVGLNRLLGSPRSNWILYVFAVSCCLIPWLWFTSARRPIIFMLVYLLATWGQMLILPHTGATLHHVILLWPFPHFLIAIAGGQLSQSLGKVGLRVLIFLLIIIVCSNLVLINHYHADLSTHGTTVIWTDAIYPLFDFLDSSRNSRIVTVDWGYATTLCLLSDGEIALDDISLNY